MFYNFLFLDLDGTLVNKFDILSRSNFFYLNLYSNTGGTINFLTGRSLINAISIVKKYDLDISYIACFNGALCYDIKNNKELWDVKIDKHIVQKIINYATLNNLKLMIYASCSINSQTIYVLNLNKKTVKCISYLRHRTKNVNVYDYIPSSAYKINVIIPKSKNKVNYIYNELKTLFNHEVDLYKTNSKLIELSPKNISKGYAIKQLCDINNTDIKKTCMMGDSLNDAPAFRVAGLSVLIRKNHLNDLKHEVDLYPWKPFNSWKNNVGYYIKKHLIE